MLHCRGTRVDIPLLVGLFDLLYFIAVFAAAQKGPRTRIAFRVLFREIPV